MTSTPSDPTSLPLRWLGRVDAFFDRLYTSRLNPLYQSGPLAVALFLVLVVTGVYLLLFYRIGAPWDSVARIDGQLWGGRWVRSLHRFASDAMVVAVAVHAVRMYLRRRSWGARTLAWVSGVVLTSIVLVIGWTGFVMVWDTQGQLLAEEGARLLGALPIFSEPVARTFLGERPMPGAFFFLNYFLHIAMPLGICLVLYVHVSRVARPTLLPPRALGWGVTGFLFALALLWPAPLAPPADPGVLIERAPLDLFYGFWLPVTTTMPAWAVWVVGSAIVAFVALAPLWTRPAVAERAPPSVVDHRFCTGCEQCHVDCPYEAISMVGRDDDRPTLVARVDPALCVSCGICAGSCAPMGVGPPGRTGRDQLPRVQRLLDEVRPSGEEVVVIACAHGAGGMAAERHVDGAPVHPVECAGNLHSSAVEYLVRGGFGGVLVVACPGRDCWNREGPRWTRERLFEGREAELQERVDRRRVRMIEAGLGDRRIVLEALAEFRASVAASGAHGAEDEIEIDTDCEFPVTALAAPAPGDAS
ncbi:MAG: hydrogenase iron-sulfur subunit [Longimicrobiales bacterium]|nr:hydrogenase iron-sulfur subunit [Longimicrobiales bacterium]